MRRRSLRSADYLPCPYCGEPGEIPWDEGGGESQEYIEDCPTCCKPRLVHVGSTDSGEPQMWLERA